MTTIANQTTLRPGLLVSLKTSVTGNVKYQKTVIEPARMLEGGNIQQAKWETVKTVIDPVEDTLARKARAQASDKVRKVCAVTAFGMLCPQADKDLLEAAIRDARKIVDDFNATSKLGRVSFYVISGTVAADDIEAIRALNSEVVELLDEMTQGLQNADAATIRKAASRAREISGMLAPDAEARLRIAIDTARAGANQIARADGDAALAIDQSAIRKVAEQRTAFIDVGEAVEVKAPTAAARSIDTAPELLPSGAEVPQARVRADLA